MFEPPKNGQFTQGTVFSCGYAENYPNTIVHGLVITARCDAAQNKVPIYSFIPVVSLRDWIFRDGADITLRRVIEDAQNTLENLLEESALSTSLLRTTSSQDIVEKVLKPLAQKDRKLDARIKKFQTNQSVIWQAEGALESGDRDQILSALRIAPKLLDRVIKDLSGNKITGHYLLRDMPTLADETCHHVALLREVHHIPSSTAQRITRGISKADWTNDSGFSSCCPVFLNDDDYCMPVGKLRSPRMEHLMQSWSLLFSRIGVDDIDSDTVRRSLDGLGLEAA